MYHLIALFLDGISQRQFPLYYLVNFRDSELEFIQNLRRNRQFPIQNIQPGTTQKKRVDMYKNGGFFGISLNQLCFDFIRREGVSISSVDGLLINNVENILTKKDLECWLATILKNEKPRSQIFGFCQNAQSLNMKNRPKLVEIAE